MRVISFKKLFYVFSILSVICVCINMIYGVWLDVFLLPIYVIQMCYGFTALMFYILDFLPDNAVKFIVDNGIYER